MRGLSRLACLLLLVAGLPAWEQATPPQRPFAQLADLWTRQLDRIATRTDQANLLPVEIDALREQAADVRAAASAAANLSRNDLADTRRLTDCFPSIDYFEQRGTPFIVAVNCFDGAERYEPDDVRIALDLDPEVNEKLDTVFEMHGVPVVIDKRSLMYVTGAVVDHHDELNRRGFSITNPSAKSTCGCGSSFSM